MSVTPLLVHLAEFITLLLVVLAAYKIITNYKATTTTTTSTEHTANFDLDPIETGTHSDTISNPIPESSNNKSKQKRETVLNDYIGDFF